MRQSREFGGCVEDGHREQGVVCKPPLSHAGRGSDPCPETQRVAFWLSLSPGRTGLRKIGHGQVRSFPPSFLSNASLSCLNANTTLSSLSSHNSLSEILYEMKCFNYYHGFSYLKVFSCLQGLHMQGR